MSISACVLASGSSGNATLVSSGDTHLLIDCGLVAKEIEHRLTQLGMQAADLSGILISHAHTDHFRSTGTIHARYGVPVYIDSEADRSIRRRRVRSSYSRVSFMAPVPSALGSVKIETFSTSHTVDGGEPIGFVLSAGGARIGVATDTGSFSDRAIRLLRGCQILIIEANYDEQTVSAKLSDSTFAVDWKYLKWVASSEGHLSNDQCARLLAETVTQQTQHVFLAHISENHNDPRRDNNSFEQASRTVTDFFRHQGLRLPSLYRTYRRGATEGRASISVSVD